MPATITKTSQIKSTTADRVLVTAAGRVSEATAADVRSLISVYSTSQVDGLLSGLAALTSEDIDTLAKLNAILSDADVASVSYVAATFSTIGHGHTLSDISDAGSAAAADSTDFATAAQGSLAESALQPGSAVLTTGNQTVGGVKTLSDHLVLSPAKAVKLQGTSAFNPGSADKVLQIFLAAPNDTIETLAITANGGISSLYGAVSVSSVTAAAYNLQGGWGRFKNASSLGSGNEITSAYGLYLAPASGYAVNVTESLTVAKTTKLGTYTVGTLPSAAANTNALAVVTDSSVAASGNYGATVSGGGANRIKVFSNGTNWVIS